MMKQLIILKATSIYILLCVSNFSLAQNIDSLWLTYNNHNLNDTTRLNALEQIGVAYSQNKPDTAIIIANNELKYFQLVHQKKYEGGAYKIIASSYFTKGDYANALDYFTKSLNIFEEIGDKSEIVASLNWLGTVYGRTGDYSKGLLYEFKALKILEPLDDFNNRAECHMEIGNSFYNLKDFDKTLEHWEIALKLYEKLNDSVSISKTLSAIGQAYIQKKDNHRAGDYLKQALALEKKLGNKNDVFYALIALAGISDSNVDKSAIDYFKSAQAIADENDDKQEISFCLIKTSEYYLKNKNITKAIEYAQKSLAAANQAKEMHYVRWASKNLWQMNENLGNYKEALINYQTYKNAEDSINNVDIVKKFADQEIKIKDESYKINQAKKESAFKAEQMKKEVELKHQKTLLNFFIAGFGLVIILVLLVYRNYREKRKSSEELAKKNIIIEQKNKDIIDSIMYARRIQTSLLPTEKYIDKNLKRMQKK
jgi:tetratricopeptide (TPR) repeat protein